MPSPLHAAWLAHVQAYRSANACTFKQALVESSASYRNGCGCGAAKRSNKKGKKDGKDGKEKRDAKPRQPPRKRTTPCS